MTQPGLLVGIPQREQRATVIVDIMQNQLSGRLVGKVSFAIV